MHTLQLFACLQALFIIASAHLRSARTSHSCTNIETPHIQGTKVSIETRELHNHTVFADGIVLFHDINNINACEVNITLTHAYANDKVLVQVWLPLQGWNGNFGAFGGGAWAAGFGDVYLAPALLQGFAAGSTDAGLTGGANSPGAWALKPNGEVNLELLKNFASRSVHDLAVVGKAVTASYFGTAAKYSYWNGCSTGGRQGLAAAQKYPKDFDGILAGAPAINWAEYVVAEHWPHVVMKEANIFPSVCELNAVMQAGVAACDAIDGVKDGVITNLSQCSFDPFSIVGSTINCNGKNTTISPTLASIVRQIWDGPKASSGESIWPGLTIGAPMDFLANAGSPFFVSSDWIKYFLLHDPGFNTSSISFGEFLSLFQQSVRDYAHIMDSASPDLSAFRDSGGKLLVWHGLADPLIFPQGTIRYRQKVERRMGSGKKVDEFFRLFMAPGVDHCGQGFTAGAVPNDPFGALRSWVEGDKAPEWLDAETLPGAQVSFTRKVCKWPAVASYDGKSNASQAESFVCS